MTPEEAVRDRAACAWEIGGALGIRMVVRDNGDIAVDPEQVDDWWAAEREIVVPVYNTYFPVEPTAVDHG